MLSYMDLIQNCFYKSTNWSWDNTYEHILATPRNLLHFPIPNGVNVIVSNRNTEKNYSSINISQVERVEGSLSYLSSSEKLDKLYKPSRNLPIVNVLQGYRYITTGEVLEGDDEISETKPFLLYGKMYFPSQFIEGMLIKRFSPNYQLIVKFVNTPKLNKLTQPTSIFTLYLQRQTKNSSQDFIYSTREDLLGFRCLYHMNLTDKPSHHLSSSKLISNRTNNQPSTFAAGCELWYSIGSVSPGVSIAARYTTYIDSMKYLINNIPSAYSSTFVSHSSDNNKNVSKTGGKIIGSVPYAISSIHPLTFTLAMNPLLGTVESTYAIRSDGYFKGTQILRSKLTTLNASDDGDEKSNNYKIVLTKHDFDDKSKQVFEEFEQQRELIHKLSSRDQHNVVYKVSDKEYTESNVTPPITDIPIIRDEENSLGDGLLGNGTVENDEYISSLKISGNLTKQNLRVAWEGKFYDWFISSGASINMKSGSADPRVVKYGVEFAYNA